METDDYKDLSILDLQSILKENPKDVLNIVSLANAYFEPDRIEDAKEQYKKALEIEPDEEDALYNLGICLVIDKKYPEAAKYFERFLKIYPEDNDGLHKLGVVFMRMEKFEEALVLLQKSVTLNPDSFDTQLSISLAYEALSKGSEAIHHSQQAENLAEDMETKNELKDRVLELYKKFGSQNPQ